MNYPHDRDGLANELNSIWAKYHPQRDAERNAKDTLASALADLQALNQKRATRGLGPVGEYAGPGQSSLGQFTTSGWPTTPKSWRDELDAELLAAVKRYLEP